jgi:hypothetical protein
MLATAALALSMLATAAPPSYPPDRAPEALRPAVAKADAAAQTLQRKLSGRLGEALKAGGPAAAIHVCRDEAARLTEEAGREAGVTVGRTSDRLRSAKNAPPEWTRSYLEAAAGKKAADVQPAVVDLGDRVGVLRPIPVGTACTRCHGGREAVPEDAARAIAAAYPDDRAHGYAEGDFRGFVWAVVPK